MLKVEFCLAQLFTDFFPYKQFGDLIFYLEVAKYIFPEKRSQFIESSLVGGNRFENTYGNPLATVLLKHSI